MRGNEIANDANCKMNAPEDGDASLRFAFCNFHFSFCNSYSHNPNTPSARGRHHPRQSEHALHALRRGGRARAARAARAALPHAGAGGRRLRGRFPRLPDASPARRPVRHGGVPRFPPRPAPVIGLSCMANLLPFTILAMRALKERYPDRTLVLGGVGTKAVEEQILARFPWIDIICRGEGELTGPELLRTIAARRRPGGRAGRVLPPRRPHRPQARPRSGSTDLDAIPLPGLREGRPEALRRLRHDDQPRLPVSLHVLLGGPGVEPRELQPRPANIVDEMELLHRAAGVDLFLFQDEFFVSRQDAR